MPYCPICEIKFKDRRGLAGHFRFKHRIEYNTGKPAKETALTKAVKKNIERGVSGYAIMKAVEEQRTEDNSFIDKIDMKTEDSKFVDKVDIDDVEMRREDTKFVNKVEFE